MIIELRTGDRTYHGYPIEAELPGKKRANGKKGHEPHILTSKTNCLLHVFDGKLASNACVDGLCDLQACHIRAQ